MQGDLPPFFNCQFKQSNYVEEDLPAFSIPVKMGPFMFVGIPYEDIIYIQAMAGLDYLIIENPWIIFIFRYGILQTFAMILFFIPLFHKWLIPYGKFNAWVICILFLSLVSSSNSLAVGSTAIAQVYLFAFAFKNQKNKYDSKDNTLLLAE